MASRLRIVCIQKEKLFRQLAQLVAKQRRLESAQWAAALRGGENVPREQEIARTAERREWAKYAILAHLLDHGC